MHQLHQLHLFSIVWVLPQPCVSFLLVQLQKAVYIPLCIACAASYAAAASGGRGSTAAGNTGSDCLHEAMHLGTRPASDSSVLVQPFWNSSTACVAFLAAWWGLANTLLPT